VTLGPLTLPTLKGEIAETVGDQLETVGAGVVPGDRRPRPLPLTVPIHGDRGDADRRVAGLRLRRQVRALLENSLCRLQGLYLNWSVDPEQNGWLLVGGGDLKYAQGGIVFGDFELALTDCYRVANTRSHRPARRIVATDRRLITTPRDTLGTLFSTDFALSLAQIRAYLPANVTDPVVSVTRYPLNPSQLATADGSLGLLDATDGWIVDYEQTEGDMVRADVKIWDRQGVPAQETSWERVYGPDQPLTATDVPTVENALVRVSWDPANRYWDVQSWTGSAWSTDATVVAGAYVATPNLTALRSSVVEWTPERAVLMVSGVQLPEVVRVKIFVTLQRGWTAPRFEVYGTDLDSVANVGLWVYAKTSGDATIQKSTGGAVAITTGGSLGTFVGLAPWAALVGPGTDRGVWLSVLQEALALTGATLAGREGVAASSTTGYVSVLLGLGARATAATDATLHGKIGLYDTQAIPELVTR
jgi:hypothetical protein